MYFIYVLLLMTAFMACITNCEMYLVVPDNQYSSVNNTLQYVIDNYFISDALILFLPGKYHLQTDLIIQNVSNFTLRGNSKVMNSTVIYCTRSAHISIKSSHNINIAFLSINDCGVTQEKNLPAPLTSLSIVNCSNIELEDCLFVCKSEQCGLVVVNVVGQNFLTNITSSHLLITHNMTNSDSTMVIRNYHHMGHSSYKYRAIVVLFCEHYHIMKLSIIQLKLSLDKAMQISSSTKNGANVVIVREMELTDVINAENVIAITITECNIISNFPFTNMINFEDCLFTKINGQGLIFAITNLYWPGLTSITMLSCRFANIHSSTIVRTYIQNALPYTIVAVNIHNTSFSMLKDADSVVWLENTNLNLIGELTFTKITSHVAIIHSINSKIDITGHITFSTNQAKYCFVLEYITLRDPTKLDIIANNFSIVS